MRDQNNSPPSNPGLEEAISRIAELMGKRNRPVLVALDGRSGTGKSTIARKIADRLGGAPIIADDFWTGGSNEEWDKRSPREKAELAIDWKRVRSEVLEPLLAGKPATWHPFHWLAGDGLSPDSMHLDPVSLIILEGAYSTRKELQDIIDFSILVEVPDDLQRRARLVERENQEYMADWHGRWDVAEDYYFTEVRPREAFDMVISNP